VLRVRADGMVKQCDYCCGARACGSQSAYAERMTKISAAAAIWRKADRPTIRTLVLSLPNRSVLDALAQAIPTH